MSPKVTDRDTSRVRNNGGTHAFVIRLFREHRIAGSARVSRCTGPASSSRSASRCAVTGAAAGSDTERRRPPFGATPWRRLFDRRKRDSGEFGAQGQSVDVAFRLAVRAPVSNRQHVYPCAYDGGRPTRGRDRTRGASAECELASRVPPAKRMGGGTWADGDRCWSSTRVGGRCHAPRGRSQ